MNPGSNPVHFDMAIDPLADAPGSVESGVCHSHQRKRTLNETMEDTTPCGAKKPRTIAPLLLNLNAFPVPSQMNQPQSQTSYQTIYERRQGVHFRDIDYASPATTIESPQISPKSLYDGIPFSFEMSGATEKQPEPAFAANRLLLTPAMTDAALTSLPATPMSHWSESPTSVQSRQNSFVFPREFATFPTFDQAPSATTTPFGPHFHDHHHPMPACSPCQYLTFETPD